MEIGFGRSGSDLMFFQWNKSWTPYTLEIDIWMEGTSFLVFGYFLFVIIFLSPLALL